MTRALIVLNNAEARATASAWVQKAPPGTRLEFKKAKRTLEQNALLWSRLTEIARKVEWYGEKLTAEDWKDVFSALLRKARIVPALEGTGYVQLGFRTSDMSKEEMNNMLALIDAFAAERGVTFNET
jgi:hypothetical protein